MLFAGLDLHKRYSYIVVVNEGGEVLAECRLANQAAAKYIGELRGPVQVTLEATFSMCSGGKSGEFLRLESR
jgi:hypothetical protein